VAAIHAEGLGDDALSLSAAGNDNARSMQLLHQYFMSLAQTGTVRSIMDEKYLVTTKVAIIFKRIEFINVDVDLTFEGNIAKILYKQMRVPEDFQAVWQEQMKVHVRKKMDERRSNGGAAIKKSIVSKLILFGMIFSQLFTHISTVCVYSSMRSKKSTTFRNLYAEASEQGFFCSVIFPFQSSLCPFLDG